MLRHVTQNASGGLVSVITSSYQGVSGTALRSGGTYRAVGGSREMFTTSGPPPLQFTEVGTFQLIGQGSAVSLLGHGTLHVTVNANGEMTATSTVNRIECR